MEEVRVVSDSIASISFYGRIMFVKFKNGCLLGYCSVPRDVFDEFVNADEFDEFYKKRINPLFPSRRMA